MIGLSVALAARRAQFPEEFDLLVRLSGSVFRDGKSHWDVYENALPVKIEDWMTVTNKLVDAFGLRLVGNVRKVRHGYVRLPSGGLLDAYVDSKRGLYREAKIGCARWTFDLAAIRSWGE